MRRDILSGDNYRLNGDSQYSLYWENWFFLHRKKRSFFHFGLFSSGEASAHASSVIQRSESVSLCNSASVGGQPRVNVN